MGTYLTSTMIEVTPNIPTGMKISISRASSSSSAVSVVGSVGSDPFELVVTSVVIGDCVDVLRVIGVNFEGGFLVLIVGSLVEVCTGFRVEVVDGGLVVILVVVIFSVISDVKEASVVGPVVKLISPHFFSKEMILILI